VKVQQAFVEKRSTFLSGSDWINAPFEGRPKAKLQQLLDLAAQMTTIIANGYQMLQGVVEGTKTLDPTVMLLGILELIYRCWKIDVQLENFWHSLGPVYWPELRTESEEISDEDIGNVFPVAFKYSGIRLAHPVIFYWATSAILWSGLSYAYKLLLSIQVTNTMTGTPPNKNSAQLDIAQLPPLGHRTDITLLARNICQSINFCLADDFGGVGSRAAVFPLEVRHRSFSRHSWLRAGATLG
jgi:hypothetical protein